MEKLKIILAVVLFMVIYLFASTSDWTEEVLQSMTEAEYREVVETLGDSASDYEIARFYWDNR